jgi:hypothetical protein
LAITATIFLLVATFWTRVSIQNTYDLQQGLSDDQREVAVHYAKVGGFRGPICVLIAIGIAIFGWIVL